MGKLFYGNILLQRTNFIKEQKYLFTKITQSSRISLENRKNASFQISYLKAKHLSFYSSIPPYYLVFPVNRLPDKHHFISLPFPFLVKIS